jgi:hypothetical protein
MKRLAWLVPLLAACGGGSTFTSTFSGGVSSAGATTGGGGAGGAATGSGGGTATTGTGGSAGASTGEGAGTSATSSSSVAGSTVSSTSASTSSGSPCGTCPSGYTCGTANSLPVCRAASGIPMFSHVFLVVMENTSLSTLTAAMTGGAAPHIAAMGAKYASGSDYHGAAHPSLPNYIALTSGGTQGIACDGDADPTLSACSTTKVICEGEALFGCSCSNHAMNIADQLEAAGKSWKAFGEDMGTSCNITDSGNYAQRHVPFLYYSDIQSNTARCQAHVVDFGTFSAATAAVYNFIAPNLIDDMHNPDPTDSTNIPNGDKWLGPQVTAITAASNYQQGGLVVVVWDEDDGSGGILGDTDDPIGIFVLSPYAKSGGYVSSVKANHYSLLATIEDGLGLPRLGMAASPGSGIAATLADYFPAN